MNIIVTRHQGAVEWLAQRGINGDVISHATAEDVRDRTVYGMLPLHLAAEADVVHVIDMPDMPPEARGQDLSPEQMDEYGARLTGYVVSRAV